MAANSWVITDWLRRVKLSAVLVIFVCFMQTYKLK